MVYSLRKENQSLLIQNICATGKDYGMRFVAQEQKTENLLKKNMAMTRITIYDLLREQRYIFNLFTNLLYMEVTDSSLNQIRFIFSM